jgi:hypothetical protein
VAFGPSRVRLFAANDWQAPAARVRGFRPSFPGKLWL